MEPEYEQLLNAFSDPAFLLSADSILAMNDALAEITGYGHDQIIGNSVDDCPFLTADGASALTRCLRNGDTTDCVSPVVTEIDSDQGEQLVGEISVNRIDSESALCVIGVDEPSSLEDGYTIDDWKYFMDRLTEISPIVDISSLLTTDHEFISINEEATKPYGMEPSDFIGQTCYHLVHDQDEPIEQCPCEEAIERGESIEGKTFQENGRHYVSAAAPIYEQNGEDIAAIAHTVRDVTEQKQRERALKQYQEAIEASDDMIVVIDTDERYVFANSTYCEYFDVEDPEGRAVEDVIDEAVYETVRQHNQEVFEGATVTYERTEPSSKFEDRTLAAKYAPIYDGSELTGLVAVLRDITELKRREKQLREQRDNLEILNQVLRHDIRNDLQMVTAYADLLSDHVEEEAEEYVETIRENAAHAVNLTNSARELAAVMLTTTDDTQRIDLQKAVTTAVTEKQKAYPTTEFKTEGALPAVSVSATPMLASVFDNLLKNAVQHNDKDLPTVTVSARELDDTVAVEVADNGPGVPPEKKDTIFGKGQTGLGSKGSGIGLYLVRRLVEEYGGDVWVEDNEPEGSVFVVELPRAEYAE